MRSGATIHLTLAVADRLIARQMRITRARKRSKKLEVRALGFPTMSEVISRLLDHVDNDDRRKRESAARRRKDRRKKG